MFYLIDAWWRIYVSVNWVIMGSDTGFSPDRHQAITWTNADTVVIRS